FLAASSEAAPVPRRRRTMDKPVMPTRVRMPQRRMPGRFMVPVPRRRVRFLFLIATDRAALDLRFGGRDRSACQQVLERILQLRPGRSRPPVVVTVLVVDASTVTNDVARIQNNGLRCTPRA